MRAAAQATARRSRAAGSVPLEPCRISPRFSGNPNASFGFPARGAFFVTFSLVELFRSYRPVLRRQPRNQPKLQNSDADAVWQECLERDIYGANTADYSLQPRRSAARQQSASKQPKPNRQ
jgi:hypothetical protein